MAKSSDAEVVRGRGRPRSEECHRAILSATVELLNELPYGEVTMEAIAARAACAKQTLYKWWPNKARLAMEAWAAKMILAVPIVDDGPVEANLMRMMRTLCRVLSQPAMAQTMSGLMAEAQTNPELGREFRETYIGPRRAAVAELLTHGIARGELRADIDTQLVLDMMFGPLWYRLLLRNAPLDDRFAKASIDHVMAVIRSTTKPRTPASTARAGSAARSRSARAASSRRS